MKWIALQKDVTKSFNGKIRNYLNRLRKEQLELLNKKYKPRSERQEELVDEILFAQEQWDKQLQDMLAPVYAEGAKKTLQYTSDVFLASSLKLTDPAVVSQIKDSVSLVTQINDTIRKQLRQEIAQGINAQETLQGLSGRIKDVMNAANGRALTIARTETIGITGPVQHQSVKTDGATDKAWSTVGADASPPPRNSHLMNEGQGFIPIDQPYQNGQMYVGDMGVSAQEIVNCRCAEDFSFSGKPQANTTE